MQKLWKLLNLYKFEYTTHETLEEVHHYIKKCVGDMQYDYRYTDRTISTEYPNYEFHYVIVIDDHEFRGFLYFFDSIEEQCDCFEEELHEREQLISDMCEHVTHIKVHRDVDIDEITRKYEDAYEAMESVFKDEIRKLENERNRLNNIINKSQQSSIYGMTANEVETYYKEMIKSKENRIDELMRENKKLEKALAQRDRMLEQIRDAVYPF